MSEATIPRRSIPVRVSLGRLKKAPFLRGAPCAGDLRVSVSRMTMIAMMSRISRKPDTSLPPPPAIYHMKSWGKPFSSAPGRRKAVCLGTH